MSTFGVRAPDGSAAIPQISFANDTDSGLYHIGANNVGAAAAGAKVWEWGTGGLTLASGKTLTFGDGTTQSTAPAIVGSGCRIFHNTTQSVPNATATLVSFNSEEFDTDSYHDTATNNSRITIPSGKGGLFLVVGQLAYASGGASQSAEARILKNGIRVSATLQQFATSSAQYFQVTTPLQLVAGDYLQMQAFHQLGGAVDLNGNSSSDPRTFFSVVRLGS
jgi:hypothetical protein